MSPLPGTQRGNVSETRMILWAASVNIVTIIFFKSRKKSTRWSLINAVRFPKQSKTNWAMDSLNWARPGGGGGAPGWPGPPGGGIPGNI
eukprot:scaffold5315_cov38-Prasinocladus_malaysianus.AAC.1